MKTAEEIEKEIEGLKKSLNLKKVISIAVPIGDDGDDGTAVLLLKKPDRATYGIVDKLAESDKFKAIEAALRNMYIGGDKLEVVLNDTDAMVSCERAVVELMKTKKVEIKKN